MTTSSALQILIILLQLELMCERKICVEASACDASRVVHLIVLLLIEHSTLVLVDPYTVSEFPFFRQ